MEKYKYNSTNHLVERTDDFPSTNINDLVGDSPTRYCSDFLFTFIFYHNVKPCLLETSNSHGHMTEKVLPLRPDALKSL